MDPQIRTRFNDVILQEAGKRYGIANGAIRPLDAFESFIYEFERGSQAYVLRISHSLRRSEALIQGELDWINYLAEGGVSAARAIRSEDGNYVETIEDSKGGNFLAAAFVKAHGQSAWESWSPALFQAYGELLGSLHALTKVYEPAQPEWRRPDWDDDLFEFVERYLPASESLAKAKYQAVCDHARRLPRDRSSYGLIHQDAHGSNLVVDEDGLLTLFDFDECAYSWFINDIAIALFYIAMGRGDVGAFTAEFMSHFLHGYAKANRLDPEWLKEIPAFLKMREIELYAVIHRDFEVHQIDDEWCDRFMRERKSKIERDVPYIDFNFESLSEYL